MDLNALLNGNGYVNYTHLLSPNASHGQLINTFKRATIQLVTLRLASPLYLANLLLGVPVGKLVFFSLSALSLSHTHRVKFDYLMSSKDIRTKLKERKPLLYLVLIYPKVTLRIR